LDRFDRDLKQMDAKLESKLKPYERQMELLDGIPGINWVTAATVIAEIGIKMSQWPTVGHLTSWAGLCPGQNESAGKRGKSNIRPGNPLSLPKNPSPFLFSHLRTSRVNG